MPDALDGDFSRSRAVLIGTWDYQDLEPVPAAEHSLDRMRALLASPLCGSWPEDRVSVIDNRARLGDLPHELVVWLRDAVDVALFYYVGHGQYDYDDRLCLALGGSSPDPVLRTTTSLTFDAVRLAFRASKAATKIAILDCCFAELAGRDGKLAGADDLPRSPGFYLMMASGEFNTAWFEKATASTPRPQTHFTKCLADVIEAGIPDQPEGLTLTPIFAKVADTLASQGLPEPRNRASDRAVSYVLAHNAAPPGSYPDRQTVEAKRLRDELIVKERRLRELEQVLGQLWQEGRSTGDTSDRRNDLQQAVEQARQDVAETALAWARTQQLARLRDLLVAQLRLPLALAVTRAHQLQPDRTGRFQTGAAESNVDLTAVDTRRLETAPSRWRRSWRYWGAPIALVALVAAVLAAVLQAGWDTAPDSRTADTTTSTSPAQPSTTPAAAAATSTKLPEPPHLGLVADAQVADCVEVFAAILDDTPIVPCQAEVPPPYEKYRVTKRLEHVNGYSVDICGYTVAHFPEWATQGPFDLLLCFTRVG